MLAAWTHSMWRPGRAQASGDTGLILVRLLGTPPNFGAITLLRLGFGGAWCVLPTNLPTNQPVITSHHGCTLVYMHPHVVRAMVRASLCIMVVVCVRYGGTLWCHSGVTVVSHGQRSHAAEKNLPPGQGRNRRGRGGRWVPLPRSGHGLAPKINPFDRYECE